jgi:hypothetical protein
MLIPTRREKRRQRDGEVEGSEDGEEEEKEEKKVFFENPEGKGNFTSHSTWSTV